MRWFPGRLLTATIAALAVLAASSASAIVNGDIVSQPRFLEEYPWAVALENPATGGVCTAVLISPTFLLTAAHCASARKRVLVGDTARSRATVMGIAESIRHPAYDKETHQFDIGLLRLMEPVDLPPVPLIGRGEMLILVQKNAPAQVLGWGKTPGSGKVFSDRLVRARINLKELAFLGTDIVYTDGAGPCGGDSGGPMLVEGLDGYPVLVGIASTTDGNLCAKGGGMALYTSVDVIRDFIVERVPDLPK